MIPIDLTISLALIGIALVVILLSRMGALPKRSLPYVAGALAAAFGVALFRGWRRKAASEQIRALEQELQAREARLAELKKRYDLSERQVQALEAKIHELRAAYSKEMALLEARSRAERERIDHAPGDDVYREVLHSAAATRH